MRRLLFILGFITAISVSNAFATGAALGRNDFFASMLLVAMLGIVLVMVYLFNFINRIFKDPDYRERIKSGFMRIYQSLIDRLRGDDREYLRFQSLN